MEKKKLPKLSLSRETLRVLSTDQLKEVEGGVTGNCSALCSHTVCADC